ncbi:uncharacterized protein LOC125208918 isoform X2 [Salvia hispanica]|uniref:uncharacterized protein LOC125208918 isoform X2 n=1 Tax=Salvia hispanica TaxID=49212 RepID=UPI00200984B7|nr:uncharacterized protein LOC125208918 isoform X2 [Salvia hispanica]
MAARRLGRFATSATRCLPLCNSERGNYECQGKQAIHTLCKSNKSIHSLTDDIMVFDRATGELKNHGGNKYAIYPKLIPFVESFVQLNGITHVEEFNLIEDEDEDED